MNNTFIELSRNLARPITRRSALKRFGLGLAGLALTRFGLNQAHAVTNGQLDGNAHPNVGGFIWLVSPAPPTPPPLVAGSGVLVHPRVVLTAGHVTDAVESFIAAGSMSINDLLVSFASNAFEPGSSRAISAVVTHPAYVPLPWGNGNIPKADVGVAILAEPVTGVQPFPLPPLDFLDAVEAAGGLRTGSDQTKFTVVGYGIDPADANSGHLPFPPDGLRRVAQSEFRNLHEQWLFLDQNVAHDDGGTSTGDSGGPVLWIDPLTAEANLVAINSRGNQTSSNKYRVDTQEALGFLNQVIANVEAGLL